MQNIVQNVEQNLNNLSYKSGGWNWLAFLLGPFWYLINGLIIKGVILLLISIITLGYAIPIVWIYCALRGNSDLYEKKLKSKSKIDLNKI